jgi:hypothetical protein
MMKREASLKAALMLSLRQQLPGFVCQRHEERFTAGWPDISVTGHRRTSFWEVKHGTPSWQSRGIQDLTMLRLARASFHARYIIYHEQRGVKRTLIIRPELLHDVQPGHMRDDQIDAQCPGFDHAWLTEHIKWVHLS